MDLVLNLVDVYVLTPYIYPSWWDQDDILRQTLTLSVLLVIGGYLMYFFFAFASYVFLFDKRLKEHPQFLENQVTKEIAYSSKSLPIMALLTVPIAVAEVRGYSNLYMGIEGLKGWLFISFTTIAFLMFTDCTIYWIHRLLHHRLVYKYIHKDHHRWKIPSPFASHAFHPIDGWLQALPYHIYPFLFPLHKVLYLVLFVFVNMWTVSIHDGDYRVPSLIQPFINGAAHHTDHHLYYMYNYGQFFTLWDHLCGSFRYPTAFEGHSLIKEIEENNAKRK